MRRYGVFDVPPEPRIDELVQQLARTFQARTAAIAFVDSDRFRFYASVVGIGDDPLTELPRRQSFCQYTVDVSGVFFVTDARADARFADLPIVNRTDGYRFYAGTRLVTPDGHPIGTICVLDQNPRTPTPEQFDALQRYSTEVVALLERRAGQTPARASPPRRSARRTVLVVDDEAFIRDFVVAVLRLQDLSALEAANGAEALALFRQHEASVGLVLTDINMPVMDGLELVHSLRNEAFPPAIAVMSGRFDQKTRTALAAENVTCLLPKPFVADNVNLALALLPD